MGSASAGDDQLLSSTTVTEKACHVLKIDGYSRTTNTAGWPCFSSCPFRAGGYTWHINYLPKGSRHKSTNFVSFFSRLRSIDFISIFLVLVDNVSEAVKAQATFSLVDQDRKPVPSYTRTSPIVDFSAQRSFGYEMFIKREDLEKSQHLKDDCFLVRVDLYIVKEAPETVLPQYDMQHHLGDLLSTEDGTDVEFHVSGKKFVAHRLILGARSSVFRAQLFSPTESIASHIIKVDDMEAHVLEALLFYIYTDALPEMAQEDESAMVQRLLVAADKYKLQRLKKICEDRLCNHIDTSSAATILELSEKHHCPCLKKACFEFIDSSTVLFAIIETKEFEYLAQSYPAITKELISNVIARYLEKAKLFGCNGGTQVSIIEA